jgi:HK97 family phage major capsid protein
MTIEEMRAALEEARARHDELTARNNSLIAADDADMSEEDATEFEANIAEIPKLAAKISRLDRMVAAATPQPGANRRTVSDQAATAGAGTGRTVPATARVDQRTGGFRHLGEFAACARAAAMNNEGARNRIMGAIGMNEGIGEDGGFLVPTEFRDNIMKLVEGENSLLSMCDTSTTSRNSVSQNVDKTTPWGTSGINVYWEGEGQAAGATKQPTEQNTVRLNKLFARVDVTDELLEDAPQLDNYLRVKAPEVMTSVLNLAIVQGNGVGKPLGFMNSPALVTVAAETSQPADTIMHRNLVKMMGRIHAPSWTRARWLMHQDVWAQLPLISFRDIGAYPSTATGSAVPAYMPPSGIAGAPYGTLFGRPIEVLEAMETIGDLGDIALCDMTQYRAVTKTGGTRVDTSIHLKFDTDETVFRFIFRVAGNPWWSSTISPRDGSNTRSPFITLASR